MTWWLSSSSSLLKTGVAFEKEETLYIAHEQGEKGHRERYGIDRIQSIG